MDEERRGEDDRRYKEKLKMEKVEKRKRESIPLRNEDWDDKAQLKFVPASQPISAKRVKRQPHFEGFKWKYVYGGTVTDYFIKCGECEYEAVPGKEWKRHLKQHRRISCPEDDGCQRVFTSLTELTKHRKKDHGAAVALEKRFLCEVCGSQWTSQSALTTHQVTHMSEKPHACSHCEMSFKRRDQLQQHEVEVHPSPNTPSFQCPDCSAKFPRKWNLCRHVKLVHKEAA
ncbi:hypothetical protein DMENIID0001_099070 [Sergentomyia squamirostris]